MYVKIVYLSFGTILQDEYSSVIKLLKIQNLMFVAITSRLHFKRSETVTPAILIPGFNLLFPKEFSPKSQIFQNNIFYQNYMEV